MKNELNFKESKMFLDDLSEMISRSLLFVMSKINNYATAVISGLGCFLTVVPNKGL